MICWWGLSGALRARRRCRCRCASHLWVCVAVNMAAQLTHHRTTTSPLVILPRVLTEAFSTSTQSEDAEVTGFRHGCMDAPSTLQCVGWLVRELAASLLLLLVLLLLPSVAQYVGQLT